jgi:hydroxyethylthiazole kinase-like sugar kinase family protein
MKSVAEATKALETAQKAHQREAEALRAAEVEVANVEKAMREVDATEVEALASKHSTALTRVTAHRARLGSAFAALEGARTQLAMSTAAGACAAYANAVQEAKQKAAKLTELASLFNRQFGKELHELHELLSKASTLFGEVPVDARAALSPPNGIVSNAWLGAPERALQAAAGRLDEIERSKAWGLELSP